MNENPNEPAADITTEAGPPDVGPAEPQEGADLDLAYAMDPTRMEALDRRVVAYWLLSGVTGFVVLTALVVVGWQVFSDKLPGNHLVWSVGVIAVLSMMLLWNVLSPLLAWQRWRYEIREDLMLARYGIVVHEEKAIPISRLQHVELGRGPLERLFGLATLVVFTAGSENAAFRLPGLLVARAQALRDQILEARGDDVL